MKIVSLAMRVGKLLRLMRSSRLLVAFLRYGVVAGSEHRQRISSRLATIVDVGANRGQFALAAREWAPRAKVVSFEPLSGPAQVFKKIFGSDELITLHMAAIGPKAERCEMHVSARDDSSSLLPISCLQSNIFPGTEEVSTEDVVVAPLENFVRADEIAAPAMLKLDVQGFEYEALMGCESLLSMFDLIYCECSFVELYSGQRLASDVIEWLSGKGFRINGIYNPAYDAAGQTVQADFLFCRAGLNG